MKQSFCSDLSLFTGNKKTIICNQENFMLNGNSRIIRKALRGFHIISNPAIKESISSGRPKSGMFIAVPNSIKSQIKDVSPDHFRVQAILLQNKVLIVNTYFPVDTNRNDAINEPLEDILTVIETILVKNEFSDIYLTGDINCNFLKNTSHVRTVTNFLERNSLLKSWDKFNIDFSYSHSSNGITRTSIIDHFFWNQNSELNSVIDAGVIHHVDNKSDHEPIYCVFKVPGTYNCDEENGFKPAKPKPSWKMATNDNKEAFKNSLDIKLKELNVPESLTNCKNVKCDCKEHSTDIDNILLSTLEAVDKAAKDSLPTPKVSSQKKVTVVPGWKLEVKPFRDKAAFWFSVWKSAGRPLNCELHNIMKRTKNIYHYHVKKCQKAANIIKRNNLLNSCLNGESDIFDEIKKMRKSDQVSVASIDGVKDNVEEHFATIYKNLYNSVEDKEDVKVLYDKNEDKIDGTSLIDVEKVTPKLVKEAISHLNNGKSDPVFSFTSDCLKNSPDELFDKLSIIIRSFLIHGHVSQILLLATLVPLIKDKTGEVCSSSNYRSIAISSLILKIIDWIILLLFGSSLGLEDLQFSYQEGCSTVMCTWLVSETIDYFLRNDGEIFSCMTDMTKAFDMVQHSMLFIKLMNANLSSIFLRLIMVMYMFQSANVKWNQALSEVFPMVNGVKQGAVLSAILYCIYVNGLFERLRSRRSGCWMGSTYLGILGYADDNFLLAPSREALQSMLDTCEEYAQEHNLKFSTNVIPAKSKTKCLAFLKNQRVIKPVTLCGDNLPWVVKGKHLGNIVENKSDGMKKDLLVKRAQYIQKNNELNQEFFFTHPDTKFEINTIYNSHFTGSSLWDLFSREMEMLENSWNMSFKVMYDLPLQTHRYFVENITEKPHARKMIMKRFLRFCELIMKSKKNALKTVFLNIRRNVKSVTGRNLRKLMFMTGKSDISELTSDSMRNIEYNPVPIDEEWRIQMLKELIMVKQGERDVENFSQEEINEIIEFVCSS